ncbi:MAG: hypothetical protein V3T23_08775, partial [Nitrososphaerales archaeon]
MNTVDMSFHRVSWKRGHKRDSVSDSPQSSSSLSSLDLLAHKNLTHLSSRAASRGSSVFLERGISVPSQSVLRRDFSKVNKMFSSDFATMSSDLSTDGVLYYCCHLCSVAFKVIWVRGKTVSDVRMVRVSADDGNGVLKLSIQFIYSDDSCLNVPAASSCRRRPVHASVTESLDSSADRTFILAMLVGAKESFASIRVLFDQIDWKSLLDVLPTSQCEWVLPMDMKTGAYALGVGPIGSAFPSPYSLWSPYPKYSKPDSLRSIDRILAQNTLREKRVATCTSNTKDMYKLYESVHAEPVRLLILLREIELIDVLVPPQLHLLLGIVVTLFNFLCDVDVNVAYSWLADCGVHHSDTHGRTGFIGKHCRLMTQKSDLLLKYAHVCIPNSEFPERIALLKKSVSSIAACFSALNDVIRATFGLSLDSRYNAILIRFGVVYSVMTDLVKSFHRVPAGRSPDRHTLKVHCLLCDMPRWIARNNASLLRISEQSFETLHSAYHHFATDFKIPVLVPLMLCGGRVKERRVQEEVLGPSGGTRSGQTACRRTGTDSLAALSSVSLVPASDSTVLAGRRARLRDQTCSTSNQSASHLQKPSPSGSALENTILVARSSRFYSLVAFNCSRLSREPSAQARAAQISIWLDGGSKSPAPWEHLL